MACFTHLYTRENTLINTLILPLISGGRSILFLTQVKVAILQVENTPLQATSGIQTCNMYIKYQSKSTH